MSWNAEEPNRPGGLLVLFVPDFENKTCCETEPNRQLVFRGSREPGFIPTQEPAQKQMVSLPAVSLASLSHTSSMRKIAPGSARTG
jgi:hypothetical protein